LKRALADPTRLDICRRLGAEELCVCHLVEELGRVSLFGGPRECGGLAVQGMPSNDSETVLDG